MFPWYFQFSWREVISWRRRRKRSHDKPRQCLERQRHYSADKGPYSQGYGLPSGHIRLWELDCKEGRMLKNWCFWTVVLVKSLESPLDSKEIKPVNPKGKQPWTFIGRTDADTLKFWLPDAKSQFIGKDPDTGKDWRQEEKGVTEDEMVGWHHRLCGHEFEQTPGGSEGQGSLVCCSPWDQRVGQDLVTEQQQQCGCNKIKNFCDL